MAQPTDWSWAAADISTPKRTWDVNGKNSGEGAYHQKDLAKEIVLCFIGYIAQPDRTSNPYIILKIGWVIKSN